MEKNPAINCSGIKCQIKRNVPRMKRWEPIVMPIVF